MSFEAPISRMEMHWWESNNVPCGIPLTTDHPTSRPSEHHSLSGFRRFRTPRSWLCRLEISQYIVVRGQRPGESAGADLQRSLPTNYLPHINSYHVASHSPLITPSEELCIATLCRDAVAIETGTLDVLIAWFPTPTQMKLTFALTVPNIFRYRTLKVQFI